MRKFLGIPIKREPMSEQDFVERSRKSLEATRWTKVVVAGVGIAVGIGAIYVLQLFIQSFFQPGQGGQGLLYPVLGLAILVDFLVGGYLYQSAQNLGEALFNDHRTEKLMLMYHDRLRELGEIESSESGTDRGQDEQAVQDPTAGEQEGLTKSLDRSPWYSRP